MQADALPYEPPGKLPDLGRRVYYVKSEAGASNPYLVLFFSNILFCAVQQIEIVGTCHKQSQEVKIHFKK